MSDGESLLATEGATPVLQLAVLAEAGVRIADETTIDGIRRAVYREARWLLAMSRCSLVLVVAERPMFRLYAATGTRNESDGVDYLREPNLFDQVLVTRQPLCIADLKDEKGLGTLERAALGHSERSALLLPLATEGRVLGVLAFSAPRPDAYSTTSVGVGSVLSLLAASAVRNALLLDEIGRLNADLERRVRERTADLVAANRALADENARRLRAEEERSGLLERERAARAAAETALLARDRFLAIASHELRTPVAKIIGYAELLLRAHERAADDGRVGRHARTIMEVGRQLVALTRDLLDVSSLSAGQFDLRPQRFDLAALVSTAVEQQRERAGLSERLHLEVTGSCFVTGDETRLAQVMNNLLENAVKYSPDGGEIRVTVGPAAGEGAVVTVSDHGIGVPKGESEGVFDLFGRATNVAQGTIPGLGLGLAISRTIIESHGGRIWLLSAGLGQGSTAGFRLPLSSAAEEMEHQPTGSDQTARGR